MFRKIGLLLFLSFAFSFSLFSAEFEVLDVLKVDGEAHFGDGIGDDNVGIGTTAPGYKLDVQGTLNVTSATTFNGVTYNWPSSATDGYYLTYNGGNLSWVDVGSSAGAWTLFDPNLYPDSTAYNVAIGANDAGTAKLYVNGNVGIGTTSPSEALDLGSGNLTTTGTLTANTLTDGTLSIASGSVTSGVDATFSGTVTAGTLTDGTASITSGALTGATGITSSGTITFSGLTANRFVKTTTGGQLTVSSASAIDLTSEVTGVLPLANGGTNKALTATAGGLVYSDADSLEITSALSGILQGNGASVPSAITGTNNYLPKWSSSAPYLGDSLIYDDGTNVGIGTTSPNYKLQVNGDIGIYNSTASRAVSFLAPDTLAADTSYTWPDNYPSASGYVLTSSTTGGLSWTDPSTLAANQNLFDEFIDDDDDSITAATTSESLKFASGASISTDLTDTTGPDYVLTIDVADDSIDGTELADSITLDSTTTIDLDTNNADLNIDANTLFIDASESKVGVGTATPLYELDVSGQAQLVSGTNEQLVLRESVGGSYVYLGYDDTNDVGRIGAYSGTVGENLALQPAGGYVGIGTTSPSALLAVGANSEFKVNSTGAIASATGITSSGTITFSDLTNGLLKADGSGVLSIATGGTDYENPLTFQNALTRTTNTIELGGSLVKATTITHADYNLIFNLTGTGDFIVQDNGTDVLRVYNTGTVGIGTTAVPASQLEINNSSGSKLEFDTSNSSYVEIKVNGTAVARMYN
ncbi:MAG: hypothetical protein DRP61_01120 [Candidatus Omnitrophota bacterium]|nr:MAG: hypothetical protein DRP61_01120 [Candidatus Omnitrophota bacterium]RKY44033.1 MAG: hypothetical protein DRP80_03520 [Candidatus Omnitrophota bacterium]